MLSSIQRIVIDVTGSGVGEGDGEGEGEGDDGAGEGEGEGGDEGDGRFDGSGSDVSGMAVVWSVAVSPCLSAADMLMKSVLSRPGR